MVEVEKYIKRLLYDHDCVIIPEFGGVITHYLPARFDAASGRYLPSERKVAFNEVLKIDDGLLAKFISENEGLSYPDAQLHISDFVQTAQTLIRKNKIITLAGIGTFRLSEEGRILFQPDLNRNFHADFYGLQPVGAAVLNGGSLPVLREEAETDQLIVRDLYPKKKAGKIAWGNWISAASIACILVYVSAVLSQQPGATSSLSPIETIRTLFSPEKNTSKATEIASMPEAAPKVVRPIEEERPVEEPAEEPETVPAPEVAKAVTAGKFHVIASVYESKSSLDKYGAQMAGTLSSEGFQKVQTLTVRDKYMLSAGSYSTWNEAQRALPRLGKIAKGAWIYRQR
ncbi:SPOR domain-containing protein [Ravibacter arvi]|uniref:SPOR domain-containing protein n=1 Tax=Ravibacter arvi TaxID=2051041 RepID=A0ABP8LQ66_9BACT